MIKMIEDMREQPKQSKPEHVARAILKRFYSLSPYDADTVTLAEIFRATNRELVEATRNKAWLANQLTVLRSYGYIESIHDTNDRKRLRAIQLTAEGRKVLGKPAKNEEVNTQLPVTSSDESRNVSNVVSLETLVTTVKAFQRQNPSVEVQFNIKVREGV